MIERISSMRRRIGIKAGAGREKREKMSRIVRLGNVALYREKREVTATKIQVSSRR
jgi:hypothetical protein